MALKLESFVIQGAEPDPAPQSAVTAEDRLSAYDDGYAAGWEDAIAARDDDAARLQEQVAQNLLTLSFTWHEARQHVLDGLRPLLEQIVARLLPVIAAESLPALVADTLLPLAAEQAEAPIALRLHPAARARTETHLARVTALPVVIIEDAALQPGQAVLSVGPAGAHVDLEGAIAEIGDAIAAFYDLLPSQPLQEVKAYG